MTTSFSVAEIMFKNKRDKHMIIIAYFRIYTVSIRRPVLLL